MGRLPGITETVGSGSISFILCRWYLYLRRMSVPPLPSSRCVLVLRHRFSLDDPRRHEWAVLLSGAELSLLLMRFLAFFAFGVTDWYFVAQCAFLRVSFSRLPQIDARICCLPQRGALYNKYLRSPGCFDEPLSWISNSIFVCK